MGVQPRQVELNSSSARFSQAQPAPLTSKQTINPSLQQQLQQQRLSSHAQAQSQIRYTRQDICEQYVQPRRQQQQRAHQGNETSKSLGARKVRRAELNVSSCDSDDTACGFGAVNSSTADGLSGSAADQRSGSATSTSRRKKHSSRAQQKETHKRSQRKSLPRGIHLFTACLDSNSPHSSSQDLDFEQTDENVEPVSAGKRFLTRLGFGCATSSKRRPRSSNSMQALSSVSTTDQQVSGNEQRSAPRSQTVSNLRELAINNANDNAYANPALGADSSSSALTASNVSNQRNKHVSFEGLVGRTPAGFVQPAAATSALQLQLQPQLPLYSGASTSSSAFPVFVKQPQQPLEQQRQQQLPAATAAAIAQRPPTYLTNTVRQGPLAEHKVAKAACVTTTVYKKLPSLPMKTQATQTDITAYHLSGAVALNETQTSAQAVGSPLRVELKKSPTSSKPIVVKTNPIQHGQNQITALSSFQSSTKKPTVTTTTILTATIATKTTTTTTTTTATTLTTTPSLSSADLPPSISSASSKVERRDSFAKIKLNASQDDDDDDDERDFDLDLRIKMRDEDDDDELVEASQNLAATLATPTSSSASSRRSSQGSTKSLEAHDVAIGAARAAQLAKLTVKAEEASKKEALTPSSPPSLSEASSQTNDDVALTTRMRQVQRALTTAGLEYTQKAASSRDGEQSLLGSNKHAHNIEARTLFSKANHASLDQSAQPEHRRDDFLRGLEASSETKKTQRTSPSSQSQDEKTEPDVSPKRHEPSDRPRTSTSTLSTRHHSYCSSGELLPASSGSTGGNVVATGSISPEASPDPLPMGESSDAISTAALTLSQLDSNSSNVTSIPEASANVGSEHSLPSSANREPLDNSSSHCRGQNATIQNSTNSSFSAEALPVDGNSKSSKSSKSSSPGVTPTRDGEIQELTQTTVSELSGALSSSSPSFADTYKRKIEQVHEFAAQVTAKLITECLRESNERLIETKNSVDVARREQEPHSDIERYSNSAESSLIVEQKQEHQIKPTRQKPKLMEKPAHLRASAPKEMQLQRQDAAAAVSVTATSIAAAAARVQAQQVESANNENNDNELANSEEVHDIPKQESETKFTEPSNSRSPSTEPNSCLISAATTPSTTTSTTTTDSTDDCRSLQLSDAETVIDAPNCSTGCPALISTAHSLLDFDSEASCGVLSVTASATISRNEAETNHDQRSKSTSSSSLAGSTKVTSEPQRRDSLSSLPTASIVSQNEATTPPALLRSLSGGSRSPLAVVDAIFVREMSASPSYPVEQVSGEASARLRRNLSRDDTIESTSEPELPCCSLSLNESVSVDRHIIDSDHQAEESSTISTKRRDSLARLAIAPTIDEASEEEEQEEEELNKNSAGYNDGDDSDEQSSISISQRGVIVTSMGHGAGTSSTLTKQSTASKDNEGVLSPTQSDASITPTKSCCETTPVKHKSENETPVVELMHDIKIEHSEDIAQESNDLVQEHQVEDINKSSNLQIRKCTDSMQDPVLDHLSRSHPQPSVESSEEAIERRAPLIRQESNTNTVKRRKRQQHSDPEQVESGENLAVADNQQGVSQNVPSQQRRGPSLAQIKNQCQPNTTIEPPDTSFQTTSNKSANTTTTTTATTTATTTTNDEQTQYCSSCSTCDDEAEPEVDTAKKQQQQQQQQQQSKRNPRLQNTDHEKSISMDEGAVLTQNYWLSRWLYVGQREEAEIWRRAVDMQQASSCTRPTNTRVGNTSNDDSEDSHLDDELDDSKSTDSELSFNKLYKCATRKMIHRHAAVEMYSKLMNGSLKPEKRVEISKSNGEFGFRIHGARPVVVSAIERGTSAETCGLQIGDLIYAINGQQILDASHNEVVKLAHNANSSALVLDLVPTNGFLRKTHYSDNARCKPLLTGTLKRLSPSIARPMLVGLQKRQSASGGHSIQLRAAMQKAWKQRFFLLRADNCLYWYKKPTDVEPLGGLNLQGYSATLVDEFSEPSFVIRLSKYGGQPNYFGSDDKSEIQNWIDAINKAATEANQNDEYVRHTLSVSTNSPHAIANPECCGHLYKFSRRKTGGAYWKSAYFVLKDACLYLFRDLELELRVKSEDHSNSTRSVYFLHGYKVKQKHIENKPHTFELIPPNKKTIKSIYLMASSEIEKRRWMASLEYSIDRWIEVD